MIGTLRHRVILQVRVDTVDAGGGVATSWADIAGIWAAVVPLSGKEQVQSMAVVATQRYRVRLRHRPDITPAHRLRYDGRILNIRSVRDLGERRQWLECQCEEGVAD